MKMKDFNISMTQYGRGDIITGTIALIGSNEVIVSLGGLKEGVFPASELDGAFKVGDAILVMVTGEMDDKGCLIVTHQGVNKALQDKEKLKTLKVGSEFEFDVNDINNSGLLGNFMGYRVFLPYSQCVPADFQNKDSMKGRTINAIVIELNNIKKSIVCSTKLLANNSIEPVEIGDEIEGTVIKLEDKFAILMLKNGAKAKLSISDASYTRIDSLKEMIELDKSYKFKILDTNTDFSRISVGLKQLGKNPMDEIFDTLNLGDEVTGKVVKILPVGAVIKLENGLSAMAITRENSDRANVATHHLYKLNADIKGTISYLDKERHKINISTMQKKDN